MPRKSGRPIPPEVCPVCGGEVPRTALACPECGADHNSGWREDADAAEIPDDEFDYDAFVEREFGNGVRPHGIHPVWWVTAILLLAAFLAMIFLSR